MVTRRYRPIRIRRSSRFAQSIACLVGILILSDTNMPGMTGLELLAKAKALRPDVPVIMIAAYGDADNERKVLENYNVQVAVDTEHYLIVTHEVTNVGTDRAQLAHMAKQAKATLERANLDVIADRGYFSSEKILKCGQAGITVTLPKPMTLNAKAEGRFGKQDFRYVAEEDTSVPPGSGSRSHSQLKNTA